METGVSVIIRNEQEFNRMKQFLGSALYLDFVPQMAAIKTGIIIWSENPDFSTGSTGDAAYQEKCGFTLVEFSDYFKPVEKVVLSSVYGELTSYDYNVYGEPSHNSNEYDYWLTRDSNPRYSGELMYIAKCIQSDGELSQDDRIEAGQVVSDMNGNRLMIIQLTRVW